MSSISCSDIFEECKKIIFERLFNSIKKENVISVILYGSIAMSKERYKYHDGKLRLDSDIDLLIVIKRSAITRAGILLGAMSSNITKELNEKGLSLSKIDCSITTEKRLLDASPSLFYSQIKHGGSSIFGKDLVASMPDYSVNQIPNSDYIRFLMWVMIRSLESFITVDFTKEKTANDDNDSYHCLLVYLEKLTVTMIRVLLIKDNVYPNIWGPIDFNDLKIKLNLNLLTYSRIFDNLLKSYEELLLARSPEKENSLSLCDVKKYWIRTLDQFILTLKIFLPHEIVNPPCSNSMWIRSMLLGDKTAMPKSRLKRLIFARLLEFNLITSESLRKTIGRNYMYLSLYQHFLLSASILSSLPTEEHKQDHFRREFHSKKSRLRLGDKISHFRGLTSVILLGSPPGLSMK